jgi:hypothetical protein
MIIVKLADVHARGCECSNGDIDEECAELRGLIANDEGAEGEIYVKAVRPPR